MGWLTLFESMSLLLSSGLVWLLLASSHLSLVESTLLASWGALPAETKMSNGPCRLMFSRVLGRLST